MKQKASRTKPALAGDLADALLGTLLDHVPDNIYVKDRASRFVCINRALASYFGLPDPAAAIGRTDFDYFTEEHARTAFADEASVMKTGRPLVGKEERETWPDGRVTWVSTTKVPLRDGRGRIIGTCGMSRDVTARKAAEVALQRAHAELEHRVQERTGELAAAVARLEARDRAQLQFISTVSHEIRNPVGSITYAVHNLLKGLAGPLPAQAASYLRLLQEDCERLESTISDVLDLSRIEAGALRLNRTAVDLVALVRRVAERVAYLVEAKRQKLAVSIALPVLMIEGDAEKLERAVLNVVRNALKFTSAEGHVRLELASPVLAGSGAAETKVSVTDDGVGIPPEHVKRVTDRYYRVDEKESGTGLGLTIAKEIIDMHGGRIEIESPPAMQARGTDVRLVLPVATLAVPVVDKAGGRG